MKNPVCVTLIDSGLCNLTSVRNAIEFLGAKVSIATVGANLEGAERIVLPGVGSFGRGMEHLRDRGLDVALRLAVSRGVPLLGICLGMQLLAHWGDESGPTPGLGLISGHVRRLTFPATPLRLPHVGWNDITFTRESPLWTELRDPLDLYFTHSYALEDADEADIIGTIDYGGPRIVAVQKENVLGIQAHPEKSQQAGLKVLENFLMLF